MVYIKRNSAYRPVFTAAETDVLFFGLRFLSGIVFFSRVGSQSTLRPSAKVAQKSVYQNQTMK